VPKVNRASRCRREYGLAPRGWLWIRKRLRHGFIVSLGADDATECLGGHFTVDADLSVPSSEAVCSTFE
jgi:hypothetical protein